jgi:hypothetical protein
MRSEHFQARRFLFRNQLLAVRQRSVPPVLYKRISVGDEWA